MLDRHKKTILVLLLEVYNCGVVCKIETVGNEYNYNLFYQVKYLKNASLNVDKPKLITNIWL